MLYFLCTPTLKTLFKEVPPVQCWLEGCCICILTGLEWMLSLHPITFPLDIIIRGNSNAETWLLLSYWFKVYCLTRDCEEFYLVQKVLNAYYSEVLKYYQLGPFVSSPWSSKGPASPYLICFPQKQFWYLENLYTQGCCHQVLHTSFFKCFLNLNVLREGCLPASLSFVQTVYQMSQWTSPHSFIHSPMYMKSLLY